MKNALLTELRSWLLRSKVVHRLPGRLRLRIPALKKLGPGMRECALLWRDLLASPKQIASIEINLTSGSVLIRYDADGISEAEALAFLKSVNRFVLRHWDRIVATPASELPSVLERLQIVAREAMRQRPALDADIEVPDSVWA